MLKKYGANEITEKISVILECDGELKRITPTIQKDDQEAQALINKIIEVYGKFSGTELSNLTHALVQHGAREVQMVAPFLMRIWRSIFTNEVV